MHSLGLDVVLIEFDGEHEGPGTAVMWLLFLFPIRIETVGLNLIPYVCLPSCTRIIKTRLSPLKISIS